MSTIVETQTIQEPQPDCSCEKYFKSEIFEGSCSSCYEKNKPEKYEEFIKLQKYKITLNERKILLHNK